LRPGRHPGLHPAAVAVPGGRARGGRGRDRDLSRLPDDRRGRPPERDRGHQAHARWHLQPDPGAVHGRRPPGRDADRGAENGRWWAVWTEQVGPGGEFAPQQLFQAKTYGTAADHQQITFTASNVDNTEPSISLDGNGAVLAWTRRTAPEQPGPADLWVATNANTAWSSRVFSSDGTDNRTADVKRISGFTFLAFVRDGRIVEAENTTGAWTSHVFLT